MQPAKSKKEEVKDIASEPGADAESMKAANKRLWNNKKESVPPKVIIFSNPF